MKVRWLFVLLLFCPTFALGQSTNDSQQCSATVDKDLDLAIQYCTAAISETSSLSTNNLAASYHNRAVAYYRKDQYDKALSDVDHGLTLRPGYALSLSLRGSIYSAQGDYNRAIADFKASIAADKTLIYPYIGLSNAYDATRDYDSAIAAASEGLRIKPDNVDAYWSRSGAYRDKLDYADAARDVQSAIQLDPNNYRLYNAQADLYGYLGQWDKVFADLNKSLQLNPSYGFTYGSLAWAEWERGDGDKAMADADKALLLSPTSYSSLRLKAMIDLSRRDYGSAEINMAEAVAKDPKYYYGVLWLHIVRRHAKVDDSEEFARNTAALDLDRWPGPVMSYYLGKITRTELLAKVNSPDPGETLVRQCESNFYLGEDALAKGRRVEAAALFHRAMDICPTPFIEHVGARTELDLLPKPPAHRARKATGKKRG